MLRNSPFILFCLSISGVTIVLLRGLAILFFWDATPRAFIGELESIIYWWCFCPSVCFNRWEARDGCFIVRSCRYIPVRAYSWEVDILRRERRIKLNMIVLEELLSWVELDAHLTALCEWDIDVGKRRFCWIKLEVLHCKWLPESDDFIAFACDNCVCSRDVNASDPTGVAFDCAHYLPGFPVPYIHYVFAHLHVVCSTHQHPAAQTANAAHDKFILQHLCLSEGEEVPDFYCWVRATRTNVTFI